MYLDAQRYKIVSHHWKCPLLCCVCIVLLYCIVSMVFPLIFLKKYSLMMRMLRFPVEPNAEPGMFQRRSRLFGKKGQWAR